MRSILSIGVLLFLSIELQAVKIEHAIYLSTIEITKENDDLNIVIKVFEDDLRDALRNFHNQLIDPDDAMFEGQVEEYFRAHLKLAADSNQLDAQLIALRLVGDSYQVEFSAAMDDIAKEIEIEVSYFYELFPTQQNVLNMNLGHVKKYHIFKRVNRKKSFKLID